MHTFFCTLTGDNEDTELDALLLPISSLSLRRTASGAFITVVVPGIEYSDDISDRSNGNLQIVRAYCGSFVETLADVPLTQIITNEGASSTSISLSGEDTDTEWEPDDDGVEIEHVLYRSPNQSSGLYTYQLAGLVSGLIPGVDVTYGAHTFSLGEFQLEVSGDNMGVWLKEG